ncbi:glycosyl transferase family 2 [Pedobacter yulinensis]|uniref:Glycosyl transferase family 2 n=1 Tax=Pedobacter yulinensis TaxID=2126353 RepID=A0A2T3HLQ9_9SPHI|nr:glycosyltransferase family A protein [Pedobacter yulinensis]PST83375.1 glycosyl transferase family 2 [Pedobacter yulinensis]
MSIFNLPAWIRPHLYTGKNYDSLTEADIADLRERLKRFQADAPEISVMIPAWNEQNNIFRTLSSLAANTTARAVEIVVINNNSTDRTQELLDRIGVRNVLQPEQGTPHARQLGLQVAGGKFHLCADSDTFYPPTWMEYMVRPMERNSEIVGVYGRYSFMPGLGQSRLPYYLYEKVAGLLIRVRKRNREHINFLGLNMGFVTEVARRTTGFQVSQVRKFDNALGSDYFVDEAEDGKMAVNLKTQGRLQLVTGDKTRAFTSSRRLIAEGGIVQSFKNRLKLHLSRVSEYVKG